jgi:hypothetical protein
LKNAKRPKPVDRSSPIPTRVERVLDSMRELSEFGLGYRRGAAVPDRVWQHAEIVGEYLGYPPPRMWLWQWLNGRWQE